jgi:hypothetical protein
MVTPKQNEITALLAEIVYIALLNIRGHAHQGNSERCHIEADHVHNIPYLIANYSTDLLKFYLDLERPIYMQQSTPGALIPFEPLWARLNEIYAAEASVKEP